MKQKMNDNGTNEPLNRLERIKLLELVGNWKDNEASRFWNRFSIVLIINSGLLAAFSLAIKTADKPSLPFLYPFAIYYDIAISSVGLFVSVLWWRLQTVSKNYEARWIEDMKDILEKDEVIKEFVTGFSDETSKKPNKDRFKATGYAYLIIAGFSLMWLTMLIISTFC
ncbi:MAG: hypothetical protein K8F52_16730 [Candidatus Scalindua rubra]|uniref:Uncharacterized protein n=1 Tax=Candidatus Scalindua brodae TaxID=237368 RepID=A0A0B0EME2_9BACT|nr:MAG: hypothetical protein SCABRO_00004 [Candidatus Scalindua brodae]MBZ0110296.1 hypothetical protein [Candidatus Scalindua rubra]